MAQNVKAPCSKGPQCILSMKRLFNYLHGVSIKQIIITARCYVLINCIVWGWCLLCSLPSLNQLINAALHWSIESVLGKEDSIQWWRCFVWWCVGIHCQVYLAEYVFYNVGPTGLEKSFKKKKKNWFREKHAMCIVMEAYFFCIHIIIRGGITACCIFCCLVLYIFYGKCLVHCALMLW